MSERINEQTTRYVSYAFKNASGEEAAPTSARYRIDDQTTGRQVRGWTDIADPAASGTITLDANDTAILDRANAIERRVVHVEGTYGSGDKARQTIELEIVRIAGI